MARRSLVLKKLDKRFGPTHALKAVDLTFEQGEIHAIVGENGAGKSTLIKLLTGVHPRSSGEVFWRGAPVALATPHEAIDLGINAVHQEVVLCPHLTVAANIFLGDEEMRGGLLDHRRMVRDAQKLLDELGFALPAGALLSSLTIGQQQLVATARAERRGAKFLIFDEPTAYLTRQEAAALFKLIRRLKANGVTIVYISHRLEEVFELCDRVSVLRDGALVGTRRVSRNQRGRPHRADDQPLDRTDLPQGRGPDRRDDPGDRQALRPRLSRRFDQGARRRDRRALRPDRRRPQRIRPERVRPPSRDGGRIFWQGREVSIRSERQAMDLGIALAPESRRDQGLCLNLGVGLNINLPIFKRLSVGPLINLGREAAAADKQIRDVQIKTASRAAPATSLSGGNQQKVVIGKWLNHGAKLFIFDEPTVGVDVGTKAEIYRLLGSLLQKGAGIIMISSYLPEVYELADTLHVFRRGGIVASHGHQGRLARDDTDRGDRRLGQGDGSRHDRPNNL